MKASSSHLFISQIRSRLPYNVPLGYGAETSVRFLPVSSVFTPFQGVFGDPTPTFGPWRLEGYGTRKVICLLVWDPLSRGRSVGTVGRGSFGRGCGGRQVTLVPVRLTMPEGPV